MLSISEIYLVVKRLRYVLQPPTVIFGFALGVLALSLQDFEAQQLLLSPQGIGPISIILSVGLGSVFSSLLPLCQARWLPMIWEVPAHTYILNRAQLRSICSAVVGQSAALWFFCPWMPPELAWLAVLVSIPTLGLLVGTSIRFRQPAATEWQMPSTWDHFLSRFDRASRLDDIEDHDGPSDPSDSVDQVSS